MGRSSNGQSSLPWLLVGIGAAIALVSELLGQPSLAFAVGIYLPVATRTPVFIGGRSWRSGPQT
ncbi:MAG: hypothetical protein E2P02_03595 [Acidobacteria bacterium]|nr:MAG: hypothetical protein E2P02_03595 [Acidobacteriota bacterium]